MRPSAVRFPVLSLLALTLAAATVSAQTPPMTPDITGKKFVAPEQDFDYEKREVMIPMRDGVKLHTVIVVPRGAQQAPILLTRTPYDASGNAARSYSGKREAILPVGDALFVEDGYIRVYQDVRGKHGSEGDYVATRPLSGPLNDTGIDHATDAWDTIDWLVKHVPESNGKVGMIGSSYPGFTVVMALADPHPALKAAAPQSPMVDGWMGDDWFSYGAFRQTMLDYFVGQMSARGRGGRIAHGGLDDYSNYLRAGSAGDFARAAGLEQLPFWRKVSEHPAYDAFWQNQALDRIMAKRPLKVPTLWIQGLWDQEDMWGAHHTYQAMEPQDKDNRRNFLVMGPWRHSQVNYDGSRLGALVWDGDTAYKFRRDVLKPFFDQYLKDGAPRADTPPVLIYDTGADRWDRYARWPQSCAQGCPQRSRPLYLAAGETLSFSAPDEQGSPYEEYVSDPAKPVPYRPRPIDAADRAGWQAWLVDDQRFVDGRTDVLSFVSPPLEAPMKLAGTPIAHLVASTSGSDSDWVVKLIDVYPDEYPARPEMGGYQLAVSLSMFRGRYRESFEQPAPLAAGQALPYRFEMPVVNHTFQRGHRIMVQVQSSLFPLYDRNPQTYVPNIFFAKPGDYRKATQRIWHAPQAASYVELPVVTK